MDKEISERSERRRPPGENPLTLEGAGWHQATNLSQRRDSPGRRPGQVVVAAPLANTWLRSAGTIAVPLEHLFTRARYAADRHRWILIRRTQGCRRTLSTGAASVAVDERAAVLAARVAEAADAWLAEPRDATAYTRFVDAVLAYRAYRHPQLQENDPGTAEILDELAERAPPTAVAALLQGDPEQVLGELRRQL